MLVATTHASESCLEVQCSRDSVRPSKSWQDLSAVCPCQQVLEPLESIKRQR
jgi:hypothetical protein